MSTRWAKICVVAAAAMCGSLAVVVAGNSTGWIGTTFPGFFVMANRVVPSIGLPGWLTVESGDVFQHEVIAVDGAPVTSSAEIYRRVRERPAGSPIRYELRAADGSRDTVEVPSRRFSRADHLLLFGAYMLSSVAFATTGLLALWFRPRSRAAFGLFCTGILGGLFGLTGIDLYGPHWFFRVHVLAESLLAAALFHLALVFPVDRLRARYGLALAGLYAPFVLLAVFYELLLYVPSSYTPLHLAASALHGLGGLTLIVSIVLPFLIRKPLFPVPRSRYLYPVGAASLAALAVPAIAMGASGVFGGQVAVNAAGFTAFLFPPAVFLALIRK